MFSSRAVRHCCPLLLRRSLTSPRTPILRHATLSTLARPLARAPAPPSLRRLASTKQVAGAAVRSEFNRVTAVLKHHAVYQAGTIRTVIAGFTRIATIVVFGVALSIVSPRVYFDPETTNWMIPAVIVGGAVPLLLVHYLTAPYVATVRVMLPQSARSSKAATMRFASNVPPNTEVWLQCFGGLPWTYHRKVYFEDLRRIPSSRFKMVNLEHVPLGKEEDVKLADKSFTGRLMKRMLGGYWIDRAQVVDKSETPGAWDRMWEQIPLKGEEGVKKPKKGIQLPVHEERPAWSSPSKPKMPPRRR